MTDLHLVVSRPEADAPADPDRLDVIEALECAGWIGDAERPLEILRHPSGAVYAVTNDCGDSGVDCPNGASVDFPGDTPTVVIVAACLAAAATT